MNVDKLENEIERIRVELQTLRKITEDKIEKQENKWNEYVTDEERLDRSKRWCTQTIQEK